MTKLVKFSPRTGRMQDDFDRLVSAFFPTLRPFDGEEEMISWTPRLDVVETEDSYELEVDLPGVNKDDVQINMHDGILSISGERSSREVKDQDSVVRVERHTGRFYRSFSLPAKINEQNIQARYDNGVLHLILPKAEESKPRRISIS